ncbi:MAG: molybdopterin molybdotransferase MoeA [Candidatus Sumerlaeaceae bacterium]
MSKTSAAIPTPLNWEDALGIILNSTPPPCMVKASIGEACGRVSAAEVTSPISVPPFDNSSMDGFAVLAADVADASHAHPVSLQVVGEAPAGRPFHRTIQSGQAVQIMTGAPLPAGADVVVRVEDTNRISAQVVNIQAAVKIGTAIRRAGADTRAGELVIRSGELITPAHIALAASCGVEAVPVFRVPTIALAVGGDEVVPVEHGSGLQPGQIYDSNSPMLLSLFKKWGVACEFLGRMPDAPSAILEFLRRGLQFDVLVTVGGVSMGEHDYMRRCLSEIGANELFWKINQQPGGPMLYAQAGNTRIFGLPGNPVSAYVCADIYVQSALRKAYGHSQAEPGRISAELVEPLKKPHRKVAFVRCKLRWRENRFFAQSTGPQDSNRIRSLIEHDGYIVFPEEKQQLAAGEEVTILIIDQQALGRVMVHRD